MANMTGGRFALGLGLALLNMVLSSVGITIQRYAKLLTTSQRTKDENGCLDSGVVLCEPCGLDLRVRHTIWGTGVLIYILAAVPDVFSYMLIPQLVCTTVACFRLVFVTFLGHFVLQEHVKSQQWVGVSVCTLGTTLSVGFGPRSDEGATGSAKNEFSHPEVYAYLVVGLTVLCVLLAVEHAGCLGCSFAPEHLGRVALPVATGLAYALEKVFNTEIGFVQQPDGLHGLIEDPRYALMWLAMALLAVTDFYLNLRGPRRMQMHHFLPIAFAVGSSLQFFQSVAIFKEFNKMDVTHAALSIFGAAVSLVGAMVIGEPSSNDTAPDEENLELASTSSSDENGPL